LWIGTLERGRIASERRSETAAPMNDEALAGQT
jgi:hypothetical protein